MFVGTWRTEGEVWSGQSDEVPTWLQATDTYEWLPGGFFLIHRVEGRMGETVVHALEVIGYDERRGHYFSHAYDGGGGVATYEAHLEGDTWRIDGAAERFSGAFAADRRQLTGRWERLADGSRWTPWMTLTLTKVR